MPTQDLLCERAGLLPVRQQGQRARRQAGVADSHLVQPAGRKPRHIQEALADRDNVQGDEERGVQY